MNGDRDLRPIDKYVDLVRCDQHGSGVIFRYKVFNRIRGIFPKFMWHLNLFYGSISHSVDWPLT